MAFKQNNKGLIQGGISVACGLALSLLLVMFGISCQAPAPAATPTPVSAPTPESISTTVWSADGILVPVEYTNVKTYDNCEIHWASDDQYIYVGIKASTSGWVAVAVQPGSRMKDADMIFGFVKDGEATVYDLFSTGDFGPHPPDTELGGTDDILEFGGTDKDGVTIIEFKRALNTGDKYDNPLSQGVNKILWAYGSDDKLTLKHTKRGYGELNLRVQ